MIYNNYSYGVAVNNQDRANFNDSPMSFGAVLMMGRLNVDEEILHSVESASTTTGSHGTAEGHAHTTATPTVSTYTNEYDEEYAHSIETAVAILGTHDATDHFQHSLITSDTTEGTHVYTGLSDYSDSDDNTPGDKDLNMGFRMGI